MTIPCYTSQCYDGTAMRLSCLPFVLCEAGLRHVSALDTAKATENS